MESLFRKYRRKGVLIDTNLLLGFIVGRIGLHYLQDCRATTKYFGPEDFPLLSKFLRRFERIITTPHILTEVSNLSGRLQDPLRTEFRTLFRLVVANLSEQSETSYAISAHDYFLRVGLTDTAISMLAPERYLVLTDDAPLADLLGRQSVDVINFNHIRMGSWQ